MRHAISLLAIVPILSTSVFAADLAGRVVGISDGDTITILTPAKQQIRIRLWGIDSPESGQDFGQRAKQAASDLAFGKEVAIQVRSKDRFGRTVGDVILPSGKSLNREMVRGGWAWWYKRFAPADRELARLEAEARTAKRGLWAGSNPIAPWEWRKGGSEVVGTGVIGNRNSRIYHAPNCRSVSRMRQENRVAFDSAPAAEKAGYRKAGDCN